MDAHKFVEQVTNKLIKKLGIDPKGLKAGEVAEKAKPAKLGPTTRQQLGKVIYKDPKEKIVVTKRPKQKEKRQSIGSRKKTKKSEEPPENTLVDELVDLITNRNTLKHINKHFSKLNDKEKSQIENAVLLYLDANEIPLINIFYFLSDELYSMLDSRKNSIIELDRTMKIKILTRMQLNLTKEEIEEMISIANRSYFHSIQRHVSLMLGRISEVEEETEKIWASFFIDQLK